MVSDKWLETRFSAMMDKMDSMSQGLDELKVDNLELKQSNLELKQSNLELKQSNLELKQIVTQQALEIEALKGRVSAIEERLDLMDKHLTTIAPFVRNLLKAEDSLLLDPDYKELRDSMTKEELDTAKDILIQCNEYDRHVERYSEPAKAFGQRLSAFYQNVLGYVPRKIGQYRYLLEAEQIIVDNVLRVWTKIA